MTEKKRPLEERQVCRVCGWPRHSLNGLDECYDCEQERRHTIEEEERR